MRFLPNIPSAIRLFVFIFGILHGSVFGQSKPTYERKTDQNAEITKIIRYHNRTEVFLSYVIRESELVGDFFCLDEAISLREISTRDTIKLIYKDVDGICPYAIKLDSLFQKIEIKLVFNPVPSASKYINVFESNGYAGINFYKVKLPPVVKSPKPEPPSKTKPKGTNIIDCSRIEYTPPSRITSFESMLSGVNAAVILVPDVFIAGDKRVIDALKKYLLAMGFEQVRFSTDLFLTPKYLSGEVQVIPNFVYDRANLRYSDFELYFAHPIGEKWKFSTYKTVSWSANRDFDDQLFNVFVEMYGHQKPYFSPSKRLTFQKNQTCYTTKSLKESFLANGSDEYEGVFQSFPSTNSLTKKLGGIKKINGSYYLIYLEGAVNSGDWSEGEVLGVLTPTATPGVFSTRYFFDDKTETSEPITIFSQTGFEIIFSENEKIDFLKVFPSLEKTLKLTPLRRRKLTPYNRSKLTPLVGSN